MSETRYTTYQNEYAYAGTRDAVALNAAGPLPDKPFVLIRFAPDELQSLGFDTKDELNFAIRQFAGEGVQIIHCREDGAVATRVVD